MRLTAVELHTDDAAGLAAFYRDVIGVELGPGDDEESHFEASWGEWGSPDFFFFAIQPLAAGGVTTTGVEIGFEVDDLASIHERVVANGATVIEPPSERPWGIAASYADPAGNMVQLTQG